MSPRPFKLSDAFLSKYKEIEPDWGPIGEVTFLRTYSRKVNEDTPDERNEAWWETVQRVVEGTFNIQKDYVQSLKLPWNNEKAKKSAQIMYDKIFNFKFLPPGRGLWMMGTEFVKDKGSSALNNPLHPETKMLTKEYGWVEIGELEGQEVTVLSSTKKYGRDEQAHSHPIWVPATVSNFETQPTKKITYKSRYGDTYEVIASVNHRWFRRRYKTAWERVTTEDLQVGDYLPRVTENNTETTDDWLRIVAIKDAGEQEVLCATVPEYEQFVIEGNALTSNCGFMSTEDIATRGSFAFTWTMDALMVGVGIGFDTKGAGKLTVQEPKPNSGLVYNIPDSREGWVESLGLLIDAYFSGKELPEFTYDLIRLEGEPIRGFGGVASGPEPLKLLHKRVNELLTERIGDTVTSTDIVDMMNMIGACVVAGNVRRSAEIALGDSEDTGFITMKDYEKHPEKLMAYRWASNNSIFAEVGKTDYSGIAKSIALNGEPGVVWLENMQKFGRLQDGETWTDRNVKGTNPCSEQNLESGELCCLVETFPSRHESFEEYKETLKYAYLYGKTVTLLPTHWEETNAVLMKNRRIGTSQSGIIDAFVKHGRRKMIEWSNEAYNYLRALDKKYSDWLAVPQSIKITSVKPSGTVSLLPGVSPGIHYQHSQYYIRRMRIPSNSPLIPILQKAGYPMEYNAYGETEEEKKSTTVVSFPIYEPNFAKRKDDVSIWEQMKNLVDYQKFWADNSVSITVTFKQDEANQIQSVLEAYEDQLKSVSFLPISEHGYEQAPYEEITKEEYEKMVKKIKKADYTKMTGAISGIGSKYCDSESCEI